MRIILYIICGALFISCASRKVDIHKEEIKTKTDSSSVVRIDSTSVLSNNIQYTENYSELEIKPLHDSLPIVIDGTSYFNVVLKYKKQNKVLSNIINKTVHKSASKHFSQSKQETKNIKEKKVDKKVNNFVYLWLLLIPIGMYIYRQTKNKLFL